jgi:IS1 family transposase
MIIETRIADYTFAAMDEDTEAELKEVCKRFAKDMRFHFEWSYYAVYFEEENWLNANLAMPGIDNLLIKQ